jgi:hypothetical protein
MNPKAVRLLAQQARTQLAAQPRSFEESLSAFLMSWVGWEALRYRLLRELAHDQGWSIKDADSVLMQMRISSMWTTERALKKLKAKDPSQWGERPAAIWAALLYVETIRHRVVHGARTVDPKRLNVAAAFVIEAVEDGLNPAGWLSAVEAAGATRRAPLGAKRKSLPKKDRQAVGDLARLLKVNEDEGRHDKRVIPTLAALESARTSFFG